MIGITGAAGQVGSRVANRLAKLGIKQRLIVRDAARAPQLPGAEVTTASSYGDAIGMGRALAGVDTLFLIAARDRFGVAQNAAIRKVKPSPYDRLQEHFTAIDASAAVGVQRIVYLSALNAAEDATFILAKEHSRTEDHIKAIGLPFTFLRMNLYMDNVPAYPADDGVIRAPAGEGRISWVTRDDLADVAVAVLTQSGHDGKTYDVTGPEALTIAETAEWLSTVTGRKITYQAQTPHEARSRRNISRMERFDAQRRELTGSGLSDWEVEMFVTHYMQIATGEAATVSDAVPRLTGRPAQSLADYLQQHPASWRHLL